MEPTRRMDPSRARRRIGLLALVLATVSLAGCGTRAPYFLIESKLVESRRDVGEPDVTDTPTFRSVRGGIRTIGLQPPDVCADQGIAAGGGSGQLQMGVLRTRCGVEMAELERALARAGYRVVAWGALSQIASKAKMPTLEAAQELSIDVLLQVNALERIDIQPGRDARWERRFYRATTRGVRAGPASVEARRRRAFEALVEPKEAKLATGKRVGATINVSAVEVESGATIWFYEWTVVDRVAAEPQIEILVDCEDRRCSEVTKAERADPGGPVQGSISGVSMAGDPADESQAIFDDLVRDLVTDLAERFAGRRS